MRIIYVCLTAAIVLTCCGKPCAQPIAAGNIGAEEPATIDGCQVIARIDGQVVLACEVLWRVNQMIEQNRERIPPNEYEAVREQLMRRTLSGMVDQKLLYNEFRRNIPPENLSRIEENLLGPFEEREVPRLMKQLNVKSQRELQQELSRLGSSLADTQQSFNEHVIASEWIRSKIKINEEVSPDEMVEYYRAHRVEFEYPTQVRWEELAIRKGPTAETTQQAFAKLAQMGNDVWPRMAANPASQTPVFGDVARARSEGFNAKEGGVHDWTTQGALKAVAIDEALFRLPPGQMSPILDGGIAFHIVRVLERKEAGCKPFSDVQNDIREKLKDERMIAAQDKYLADLRKDAKIWTVYTGNVSADVLMGRPPGDTQRR